MKHASMRERVSLTVGSAFIPRWAGEFISVICTQRFSRNLASKPTPVFLVSIAKGLHVVCFTFFLTSLFCEPCRGSLCRLQMRLMPYHRLPSRTSRSSRNTFPNRTLFYLTLGVLEFVHRALWLCVDRYGYMLNWAWIKWGRSLQSFSPLLKN